MIIHKKGYARIALLGNPSDGFYGKTIALLIRNFAAEVQVWESPELSIMPHPHHDPTVFDSLEDLRATAAAQGYYGGLRLLLATCKKFADVCCERGVALPDKQFTIRYRTSIPRQVGLGGSSSIIAAAFHALMDFYGVPEAAFPMPERPNLILSVETDELGIQAGLQDRVAAVYGGLVYMDFARELLERQGHGDYVRLEPRLLPSLFVAWGTPGGESGKAHAPIHTLWEGGDEKVVRAMEQFASFAQAGWKALLDQDYAQFGELMNANFNLRRELYGDAVLGPQTLRLIEIAREHDCPAKLPGSGGAVIGMAPTEEAAWKALTEAYEAEGFSIERVIPDM
ncbi:MAG: mevalonate kinase family protein [Candidatus Zipacnadales bacterium]